MNYKLSDFTVGQTAYVELILKRDAQTKEELIQECVVEKITQLYVTAGGSKFEEHDCNRFAGLVEHTAYRVSKVLYPNREDLEYKLEKDAVLRRIKGAFEGVKKCDAEKLTLEKLKQIEAIIESEVV